MYERFFRAPSSSYFLFGPRGTGKTTWLKTRYAQALWIDLIDPESARFYGAEPERLRQVLHANRRRNPIVVDEVQRVPQLLQVVHQLIELDKSLVFVLTGSSARKLRAKGVDLLAGRAVLRSMHPFMAAELGPSFGLDRALTLGTIPLVVDSADPLDTLRAYAALYVREEVQAEGLVRNVGGFSRFLEAVSLSHASLLNVSNVARESQVERKVVAGYVDVLQDLLLAFSLPVFTRRARREMTTHPKFYLVDPGLFRSLRPKGPLDSRHELEGAALEGLVAQHLRAWIAYGGTQDSLSFWRTRGGSEVDFVVYGESGLYAIEVKNRATLHPRDFSGLRAFSFDYPEATPILLHRGAHKYRDGDVHCFPCEEFLRLLDPRRAFGEIIES
jgi:predicted AAA+ superfamily ATPase